MEVVIDIESNLLRADEFSPKVAGDCWEFDDEFNEVIEKKGTILG